jgi:hypothetical protein
VLGAGGGQSGEQMNALKSIVGAWESTCRSLTITADEIPFDETERKAVERTYERRLNSR